MAQEPLAAKGNFFHIYDFRVKAGREEEFIEKFVDFDYSAVNPMHKSPAQVKDGVLLRHTEDPQRFYLIAEWSDVAEHARILVELKRLQPEFVGLIEGAGDGAFTPEYAEVVSSTPQHILDAAAAE
jgi:hypothetical protein